MKNFKLKSPIVVLALLAAAVSMFSCSSDKKNRDYGRSSADSLLYLASTTHNWEWEAKLADSLLATGDISVWKAAIANDEASIATGDMQKSVEMLRASLKETPKNDQDTLLYYVCASYLANYLWMQEHIEEALQLALKSLDPVKKICDDERYNVSGYDLLMTLYQVISQSQALIGMEEEAGKTFDASYVYAVKYTKVWDSPVSVRMAFILANNTLMRYIEQRDKEGARRWISRQDSLMQEYSKRPDAEEDLKDRLAAIDAFSHARYALLADNTQEANEAYERFLQTDYAKTDEGKLEAATYLKEAGRWAEAADAAVCMEQVFNNRGNGITLDYLSRLGEKYVINYKAGRIDSALKVANFIFENLDSTIIKQKRSSATEMATVYETQKKDAEIAQKHRELLQERIIALIVAMVLLTIFFIIYTLVRRRSAARIAEMKAAQERIESELRIARDIQMSMVPSQFPDYEGLDMFASMTPAKEVGGDLYGYVLLGDMLYFAVGDVSGKGVPASLFMAQATRLFRTLAVQKMMPAEICSRMNEALSGDDNESGMFVTFFLGLVDLKTGHLDFCNAGHNAPVIGCGDSGADFLQMKPNAPIGLWPGLEYEGEEIDSIKGRPLFIYTDGLNEAENSQLEQFGDERLLEMLRNSSSASAQQFVETLKAEVEKHRNGAEPNDDLTMMCVIVK